MLAQVLNAMNSHCYRTKGLATRPANQLSSNAILLVSEL